MWFPRRSCEIDTVAMESTSNYWVSVYDLLEDAGIEVYLVNARYVKGVPGRKTDVCDAQWLQQLHSYGFLKKSFRPEKEVRALRYLMRHRRGCIESSSKELLLMQKVLTEMNLHLHHVFSDIDGKSSLLIIEAILQGERDPEKLIALRMPNCLSPRQKMLDALQGSYRDEHIFVLKQSYERWQQCKNNVTQCDELLAKLITKIQSEPSSHNRSGKINKCRIQKNDINAPIDQEAFRIYGVDLGSVDGISNGLLAMLLSELGSRKTILERFKNEHHLASWLGLCPDNRISGGKILRAKTRKVKSRLAGAFRLSANACSRSHSKLGDYCRRMRAKLGKAEGITATAHKLVRIIYRMILEQQPYDEQRAFKISARTKKNRLRSLTHQAEQLGYTLCRVVV